MKLSRRAKRMEQHHKRAKRNTGLSLVSLMDIFTILVFFLLVSSAEVQDISTTKIITLPDSISMAKPKETLIVMVTTEKILLQDKIVADVADVAASSEDIIPSLKEHLIALAKRKIVLPTASGDQGGGTEEYEIMIMGDREIPYKILRKIIITSTEAKYNRISLAVLQKTNVDG